MVFQPKCYGSIKKDDNIIRCGECEYIGPCLFDSMNPDINDP